MVNLVRANATLGRQENVGETKKCKGTPHHGNANCTRSQEAERSDCSTVQGRGRAGREDGHDQEGRHGCLDDFVGLIVKHLKKGNKVRITGLGILQVRARPARMGRNPATGEAIKIKASKKVAFRVAKDLKEAI